jgi:hypothetical protein
MVVGHGESLIHAFSRNAAGVLTEDDQALLEAGRRSSGG